MLALNECFKFCLKTASKKAWNTYTLGGCYSVTVIETKFALKDLLRLRLASVIKSEYIFSSC